MEVGLGRWSPDARVIAFCARSAPDQPWRIYLVDAAGGSVRPACPKECAANDLAWMPDGKKIVFNPPGPIFATEPSFLRLLDLATGEVAKFPGSEGLHSPRVSPDGSTLAALHVIGSIKESAIPLYRFSEGTWSELRCPGPGKPDWPSWSRDSQSIWYWNVTREEIMRVQIREERQKVIASFKVKESSGLMGWFNLTPDDEPMILRRRDVQQIYALELKPQ
jgi:Tol biopolymer transport system component